MNEDIVDHCLNDLDAAYDKLMLDLSVAHWDEHPLHSLDSWQHEVANGDTRMGYWYWVASQLVER